MSRHDLKKWTSNLYRQRRGHFLPHHNILQHRRTNRYMDTPAVQKNPERQAGDGAVSIMTQEDSARFSAKIPRKKQPRHTYFMKITTLSKTLSVFTNKNFYDPLTQFLTRTK
ncbi:unnamed protein product [Amoebophrya sp. A120]|nr:unnamed protein product [Amoebophrya sp. A120]|eukprot:GSA120T00013237001.1